MRLLLHVLTAWVVLSIPAALFLGRLCRLREHPFEHDCSPAVNSLASALDVSSSVWAARPLTTAAVASRASTAVSFR
jgi:hypothetical protein